MARAFQPDTIRILVATDNHVGYCERDPIRKDDSWRTFDEIMNLARTQDVDMVLLGGDLFHDNKPSRKSMYQVMRSLRQNCLGMKPCALEFLSDAAEVFEGAVGHVNYEDPDINIAIPVFSIHGNHDDPSGDGHYCSLDLLQVAGLVNFFGRVPEADNIKVKPVLLQKGATKLALFGTGSVREERMYRTFRDHKVTFFRPDDAPADYFNLMVVHQNHSAHTKTGHLPETFLPDWLDLVVWGHEHECLIDPQKNPETGFHVMQPGSSVATSLVPGEAVPKHVAVVSITGKDFTVDKILLKTVRPFVTRTLVLAQNKTFARLAHKKDNQLELTKKLMAVVDDMIAEANAAYAAAHADDNDGAGLDDDEAPPLPLVRLKVEYSAPDGGSFDIENPQRFSNRFAGRVANVNDVVAFHQSKTAAGTKKPSLVLPDGSARDIAGTSEFNAIKVEALVSEYLAAQSLKILPQGEFGDAVNQFVTKDDKHAMDTFVTGSLANQLKDLLALGAADDELDGAMERLREERDRKFLAGQVKAAAHQARLKPRPADWDSDMEGHWEHHPDARYTDAELQAQTHTQTQTQTQTQTSRAPKSRKLVASDDDMDDFDDPLPAKPAKKASTRKATAAPKRGTTTSGRRKGPFEDSESEADVIMDDDDDEDDFEAPPPKPAARRGRGAAAGAAASATAAPPATTRASRTTAAARARQTTLNFSQSQAPTRASRARPPPQPIEISGDEISDDDEDHAPAPKGRRR